MERLDKVKFLEKVSEVLDVNEDLKVWDYYWFVDVDEAILYMAETLWTSYTEAYNAGITRLELSPRCYNKDNMYTLVSTIDSDGTAFLLSLHNDNNIGYTLH